MFFTTHFRDLGVTLHPLPGVIQYVWQYNVAHRSLHLAVDRETAGPEGFASIFKYKLTEGRSKQEHYGSLAS